MDQQFALESAIFLSLFCGYLFANIFIYNQLFKDHDALVFMGITILITMLLLFYAMGGVPQLLFVWIFMFISTFIFALVKYIKNKYEI